ncbi:Dbl homology domain-containing protein [Spinellus fusiger]|nr:Dbl homology domain-containing protein [Spinellus fusiger]
METYSNTELSSAIHFSPIAYQHDLKYIEPNTLSFITLPMYRQLMSDLSIIDDFCEEYATEEVYDEYVVDRARDVVQKHDAIQALLQSETDHIDTLARLQVYCTSLQHECQAYSSNLHLNSIHINELKTLLKNVYSMINVHRQFHRELSERLKIWGPTQLVADVFVQLYEGLASYESFQNHYPVVIMALDSLFKSPFFMKRMASCMEANECPMQDMLACLKSPLLRFGAYSYALEQLVQHTEPSQPQYLCLLHTAHKFQTREKMWKEIIQDRLRHADVLHAYLNFQHCPMVVTPTRRLLLRAQLIRVNITDPSSISDIRTYILYNDVLVICRRERKESRLQYKESISLAQAYIRPLNKQLISRMLEVKKPNSFPLLFNRKSTQKDNASDQMAYGFEVFAPHSPSADAFAPISAKTCRRYIMRTRTLEEQQLWMGRLYEVASSMSQRL